MISVERLSIHDGTLLGGYAESIERLAFAMPHCRGKRVLDAGCGTGLSARYLLDHGAESVLGVDYSAEGIQEAKDLQSSLACEFKVGDLHELGKHIDGPADFGAITCFETLPHLRDPERFLAAVAECLAADGSFIVSTPNRDAVPLDAQGRPVYGFQHTAYTPTTLEALLRRHFSEITLWGQWLTPAGKLRKQRADEHFLYLCDSYYQPLSQLTRRVKRLLGRPTLPPPENHSVADAYAGDFEIAPIQSVRPWTPGVLLAICRN
jgi:SAM-dependent methyltransferase